MELVFLYGPPAVGKFTVGTELARRTGFKLFHNHLTVNLVSAVFERNSDVWLRLLRSIRRDVLVEAARHDVSLIMTAVYSGTSEHAAAWESMLEPVRADGGSVLFVQLTCARDELVQRLPNESRQTLDKLVDTARFEQLMDRFDLFATAPVTPHPCINTSLVAPGEAASMIITHYALPVSKPESQSRRRARGWRRRG